MKLPSVTIKQLLEAGVHLGHKTFRWNPKMSSFIFGSKNSIHIIDPNENGLTNLVRNLRSKNDKESYLDLITSPLDFGSKVTEWFIKENGPYDIVFNFAAIKHVRSEKDIYSIIQMFFYKI